MIQRFENVFLALNHIKLLRRSNCLIIKGFNSNLSSSALDLIEEYFISWLTCSPVFGCTPNLTVPNEPWPKTFLIMYPHNTFGKSSLILYSCSGSIWKELFYSKVFGPACCSVIENILKLIIKSVGIIGPPVGQTAVDFFWQKLFRQDETRDWTEFVYKRSSLSPGNNKIQ
jgi:hypothetical protein